MPWKFGLLKLDSSQHSRVLRKQLIDAIVNCVNLIAAGMLIYVLVMCTMHREVHGTSSYRKYPGIVNPLTLHDVNCSDYLRLESAPYYSWLYGTSVYRPENPPPLCRSDVCLREIDTVLPEIPVCLPETRIFEDIGAVVLNTTPFATFSFFQCEYGAVWNRFEEAQGYWKCGEDDSCNPNLPVKWTASPDLILTKLCGHSDPHLQLLNEINSAISYHSINRSDPLSFMPPLSHYDHALYAAVNISDEKCGMMFDMLDAIMDQDQDSLFRKSEPKFLSFDENSAGSVFFLDFIMHQCADVKAVYLSSVDDSDHRTVLLRFSLFLVNHASTSIGFNLTAGAFSFHRHYCEDSTGTISVQSPGNNKVLYLEPSSDTNPEDVCSLLTINSIPLIFFPRIISNGSVLNQHELLEKPLDVLFFGSPCLSSSGCDMKITVNELPINELCIQIAANISCRDCYTFWSPKKFEDKSCRLSGIDGAVALAITNMPAKTEAAYDASTDTKTISLDDSYFGRTQTGRKVRKVVHDKLSPEAIIPSRSSKETDSKVPFVATVGVISYTISLVCLLATLATYGLFPKLRKERTSAKLLLSLCTCLSLYIITMMTTMPYVKTSKGCQFALVMRVYLTLVTLTWNSIEAFNMYLILINMVPSNLDNFMRKALLVGLGLPAAIVIIPVAVNPVLFEGRYRGCDWVCTLPLETRNYIFLLPMFVYLCLNLSIYALIVKILLNNDNMRKTYGVTRDIHTESSDNMWFELKSASGLLVLLSVTWTSSAFCIVNYTTDGPALAGIWQGLFQFVYILFVALQGVFVFLVHCVNPPDARKQWISIWKGMYFIRGAMPKNPCRRKASSSRGVSSPLGKTIVATGNDSVSKFRFPTRKVAADAVKISSSTPDMIRLNNNNTSASHV